jgi:hypothetical protein
MTTTATTTRTATTTTPAPGILVGVTFDRLPDVITATGMM